MEYQDYINQKKDLYSILIQFFDCENENTDVYFEDLINIIISQKIQEKYSELKLLVNLIISIFDYHNRSNNFISKIKKLIHYLKDSIIKIFSNYEVFEFVKDNKFLLLIFIKDNIIHIDSNIIESFRVNDKYLLYFYPEIKDKIDAEELEQIEEDLNKYYPEILDDFENIRECGENELYICSLIRNDSVEEFIIYMNKTNLPVSTIIKTSLFETNIFLMNVEVSLIRYAAFFGSIQIFQYLTFNNV